MFVPLTSLRVRKAKITAKIGEERASEANNTSGDARAGYTVKRQ